MNKADKALEKSLTSLEIDNYKNLLNFIYLEYKNSYWDHFLV